MGREEGDRPGREGVREGWVIRASSHSLREKNVGLDGTQEGFGREGRITVSIGLLVFCRRHTRNEEREVNMETFGVSGSRGYRNRRGGGGVGGAGSEEEETGE